MVMARKEMDSIGICATEVMIGFFFQPSNVLGGSSMNILLARDLARKQALVLARVSNLKGNMYNLYKN